MLRATHLAEIAQWKATSATLGGALTQRARADVASRFGYQWAILMANRDAPDFLAKVAVLKAEEDAAIGARVAELAPTLQAQRTASRRLLSDKHRRQRMALRSKWAVMPAAAHQPPEPLDATDRFEHTIARAWRRVLFHAAAHRLTRPAGVRLVFKRKPAPAANPSHSTS